MQKSNRKRGARAFTSEMLLGRDQNRLGVGPRVSIILFFLLLLAGQYSLDRLDPRLDFASDLGQLNWSLFFFSLLAAVAVNRGVKGARIWTKKGKMFLVTVVALHLYLALSILWAPAPQDAFRDILLLVLLAATVAYNGRSIAVQEYGRSNPELLAGLAARGAEVTAVRVYRYDLPEDLEPLREAARRLAVREFEAALFTTAVQIEHLARVAAELGIEAAMLEGLRNCLIGSIGPVTTEALEEFDIRPNLEPTHPKMGLLVMETAARAGVR